MNRGPGSGDWRPGGAARDLGTRTPDPSPRTPVPGSQGDGLTGRSVDPGQAKRQPMAAELRPAPRLDPERERARGARLDHTQRPARDAGRLEARNRRLERIECSSQQSQTHHAAVEITSGKKREVEHNGIESVRNISYICVGKGEV